MFLNIENKGIVSTEYPFFMGVRSVLTIKENNFSVAPREHFFAQLEKALPFFWNFWVMRIRVTNLKC